MIGVNLPLSSRNVSSTAPSYSYLTQEEELQRLGFSASEIETILGRRYATNVLSSGATYIPPDFEIPAGTTYAEGEIFVDPVLGFEHTIVENNNTIINCERHAFNNAGITFHAKGSGTTSTRTLKFYQYGQKYAVLGQTGSSSNEMSIDTGITGDSNEAGRRAWNAWWLSDTKIAWKTDSDEITYRDIVTGTTQTFTVNFPGGEYLNVAQSDAADSRRWYSGPLTDERILAYNAGNPSVPIDEDKVYRIFHVSADKKSYIVLVYTISTDSFSYLTGTGLSVSETSTCTVHTIGVGGGTTIDHLTLTASGKGIYSNTNGEGFNYHHLDGTKVSQGYSASSHKGYCTLNGEREGVTEKGTPGGNQNGTYGTKQGDMVMIEFRPEDGTVIGYPILEIPAAEASGGLAPEYGGDQGGHPGSRIAVLAGNRDEQPTDDETFSHQVLALDPVYSNLPSPDDNKLGRFRISNLAINDTSGGDSDDPGAYPGVDFEHPNFPGRIVGEIYWTASRINHNGTERNFICRTLVPFEPMIGGLSALKTALTNADFVSEQ